MLIKAIIITKIDDLKHAMTYCDDTPCIGAAL